MSEPFVGTPWQASRLTEPGDRYQVWCIEDAQHQYIGEVNGPTLGAWEFEQIARLWAAAPELAEAAEKVIASGLYRCIHGGSGPCPNRDQWGIHALEAALARARGEAVAG